MLIFPLCQIFDLALVQIGQVLLHVLQLLCLAIFQFLHLSAVLHLKLGLHIVISRQHSIHILLCLLLGIEKTELRPIDFIFKSSDFFLKIGVFSRQKVFVLVEQVNLTAKSLIVSLTVSLALLAPAQLLINLFLLALELTKLVFKLSELLVLPVELSTFLV